MTSLKHVSLLIAVLLLSACTAPAGMRFKSTATAPATDSIVQAYVDIADEMVGDATEIVSMDRYRHGVRPTLNTIPASYAPNAEQEFSFDRYDSIYFKVYNVEVIDQYKAPVSLDYSEHLPIDPTDAVHSWASRLRPTGGVNKLEVVIQDAHMQDKQEGSADKHYDSGMKIEMRICSRDGVILASVSSVSAQSVDVNSQADLAARKAALNETLLKLIDKINGDLESKIAKNFTPYIDYSKAG